MQTIEAQDPRTNKQSYYKASRVGEIKKTRRKMHTLASSNVLKTDMQGGEKAKVTHCKLQKQERRERESCAGNKHLLRNDCQYLFNTIGSLDISVGDRHVLQVGLTGEKVEDA